MKLTDIFAVELMRRFAVMQWQRNLFMSVLIGAFFAWRGQWFMGLAACLVMYIGYVLSASALAYLAWVTIGRTVTTPEQRAALSTKDRVQLAFDFWWLPGRKPKT